MDKNSNALLKQAISEGLSLRFQDEIDSCTEEIVCSRKHKKAMAAILRGDKADGRLLSPKMRRFIVILVAALLVLASCAVVVYRVGIRDIVENIQEFFIGLTYSEDEPEGPTIDEVYELTYIPEGYVLESSNTSPTVTRSVFLNSDGDRIFFEQRTLDSTSFFVDIDNGYTVAIKIKSYDLHYRNTDDRHHYLWNDGKYAMRLISSTEISSEELQLIIEGITIK